MSITNPTFVTFLPFSLILEYFILLNIAISTVDNIIIIIKSIKIISPSMFKALENKIKEKPCKLRKKKIR